MLDGLWKAYTSLLIWRDLSLKSLKHCWKKRSLFAITFSFPLMFSRVFFRVAKPQYSFEKLKNPLPNNLVFVQALGKTTWNYWYKEEMQTWALCNNMCQISASSSLCHGFPPKPFLLSKYNASSWKCMYRLQIKPTYLDSWFTNFWAIVIMAKFKMLLLFNPFLFMLLQTL